MNSTQRGTRNRPRMHDAPCIRSLEYSHSTKILIFLGRGETNQQTISQSIDEDPGTVARELRRMRDEGLVTMRKDTRGDKDYSLNLYKLTDIGELLSSACMLAWMHSTGSADTESMKKAIEYINGICGGWPLSEVYFGKRE